MHFGGITLRYENRHVSSIRHGCKGRGLQREKGIFFRSRGAGFGSRPGIPEFHILASDCANLVKNIGGAGHGPIRSGRPEIKARMEAFTWSVDIVHERDISRI
jgi:hypothetical protein